MCRCRILFICFTIDSKRSHDWLMYVKWLNYLYHDSLINVARNWEKNISICRQLEVYYTRYTTKWTVKWMCCVRNLHWLVEYMLCNWSSWILPSQTHTHTQLHIGYIHLRKRFYESCQSRRRSKEIRGDKFRAYEPTSLNIEKKNFRWDPKKRTLKITREKKL